MRCTNRRNVSVIAVGIALVMVLSGCGKLKYDFAYDADYGVSSFQITNPKQAQAAEPFAQDICIVSEDVILEQVELSDLGAACLFDIGNAEVLLKKCT